MVENANAFHGVSIIQVLDRQNPPSLKTISALVQRTHDELERRCRRDLIISQAFPCFRVALAADFNSTAQMERVLDGFDIPGVSTNVMRLTVDDTQLLSRLRWASEPESVRDEDFPESTIVITTDNLDSMKAFFDVIMGVHNRAMAISGVATNEAHATLCA